MTTMKKFAMLTAAMVLGAASNTFAVQTYQWNAGANASADWNVNSNWTPNSGHPVAGDTAVFNNGVAVTFTSNLPTDLAEIQVTNASSVITLQPGSTATLTVPIVTISAGSLKFDANQQTAISSSISVSGSASLIVDAAMTNSGTITLANTASMTVNAASSNSGAITVPSGTLLSVNAALTNSGAMSIAGVFDAVASVTNSSNPALTISSGGIMKYRSGADLLGTATLTNNGHFDVIDGQTELSVNIAIAPTCIGDFRVDFVSSGAPELKLNASYNAPHAFTIRLLDTSSRLTVVGTVVTSGNFDSAYDPPCDGVTGTFSWTGDDDDEPDACF